MMTVKAATLHENEMDISLWGTIRKMYVDIYSVVALTLRESGETYYATAIYKYKEKRWVVEQFYTDPKRQHKTAKFDSVKEETWLQIERLVAPVLKMRLAEVLVELEEDVVGIMTLDDYLTYDQNEAEITEVQIKQDMNDAIESLANTVQVLQ